jgi:hypothetical protein
MFSVTYTQEFNRVRVLGYNPENPSDTFRDVLTFETEKDAEGFCLTIKTIEIAIRSGYDGRFAIAMTGDTVEITTETTIPGNKRKLITERIQQVIDLGVLPILKHIKMYSMEE